jgi:hypothetical protein
MILMKLKMIKKMASFKRTKKKMKFMELLFHHSPQSTKKLAEMMNKEVILFVLLFKLKNLIF